MLEDVTVEQAHRMVEYLNKVHDEHLAACDVCCRNDDTDKRCMWCKDTIRVMLIQGLYMERIRQYERDTIRALD